MLVATSKSNQPWHHCPINPRTEDKIKIYLLQIHFRFLFITDNCFVHRIHSHSNYFLLSIIRRWSIRLANACCFSTSVVYLHSARSFEGIFSHKHFFLTWKLLIIEFVFRARCQLIVLRASRWTTHRFGVDKKWSTSDTRRLSVICKYLLLKTTNTRTRCVTIRENHGRKSARQWNLLR